MEATALAELETAAQILLAPPNMLCEHILESSKVDYVLFEASGLLRDGLVREWTRLRTEEIKQLRSYLLNYVTNNPTLSNYVRERIVQVIAIIVKRHSVEDMGEDRRVVLAEVKQLIVGGNMQMQMIGCSILSAMMMEYATTVKSSDVGLPWEVHFKAKKQFELTDLISIFQFCLQALKELSPSLVSTPIPPERHNLVLRLTTLAENVLSWTFINVNLPKKLISVFETDQNPSLRPGAPWKDVILDPEIARLFFELHVKVRHDSELSHHTLNCLVQLASLNGSVMTDRQRRLSYLANYLTHFLALLEKLESLGSIQPMEALGCSNITRKIMLFYPPSLQVCLEPTLLESYLKRITVLTCHFMKAAAQKNSLDDDSSIFSEAFEHMLEAWVCVLHEKETYPEGFAQNSGIQIFNTYIQCNLSPPDGIRGSGDDYDDEEIGETEDPDRVRYKETLATIGALGRLAPGYSIPALINLLEGRVVRLHGQISRHIGAGDKDMDAVLSNLYEDLHWVLLIAGNVLTLDTDGEPTLIPAEVMRYSLSQSAAVDVNVSLQVLASPDKPASDVPGHDSSDHTVRLISAVFRLSEMERGAAEHGYSTLLSPEVNCTIAWFLKRYALSYLAPQENCYTEISTSLVSAFGQNTEGATWTINFLLSKVLSNLTMMYSEPEVIKDTIALLLALVDGKERGKQVLSSEVLDKLIELEGASHLESLPSDAKRGLLKALVLVGANCGDRPSKDRYWQRVLQPLNNRYTALINRNDLKKIYTEEGVRRCFISLIESFIGVAQGVHLTTVQQLFQFLQDILGSMVEVMGLYHNYSEIVELILEFYRETSRKCLCYLTPSDSTLLYQRAIAAIEMYARWNTGKRNVGKEAEEEQFRDLLLFMEMLTNLLSKDFIDLAPQTESSSQESGVSAVDVCLHGINIIMPLMSAELLKFPSLCIQYFKVTTLVCELYPDKICSLDHNLQKNLISSLEIGLTSVGVDNVYTLCCEFIQVLARYLFRIKGTELPMYEALRPFLKLLMDLILSQRINSDLVQTSSSTLYVLICCYQDTYKELVRFLIESQTDEENKQRLTNAFTELTQNLPLTTERINRIKFRDNFDKFIVNVRGFLLVK